jgi:hypothetical protein
MRNARPLHVLGLFLALAASLLAAAPAQAGAPAPAWAPIAVSGPTNLPPGGEGQIAVYVQNVGGATSSGPEAISVTDTLPAGLLTSGTPKSHENAWSCTPGAGQSTVQCSSSETVGPGLVAIPILIPVAAGAATPEPETNLVQASGGGASGPASFEEPVTISSTPAKTGVQVFTAATYDADGTPSTQAASHPYAGTSAIFANTVLKGGEVVPVGDPKTFEVALPPGFLGSPTATPRCAEGSNDLECPVDTQVGIAQPVIGEIGEETEPDPVHSVQAPVGYPAKFTFSALGGFLQVNAIASLRSDEDYGVTIASPNTAQVAAIFGAFFTIWGAPAAESHDDQRCKVIETHSLCGPGGEETAFVTLPADCALEAEQPPFAELSFDTWLTAGEFDHQQFPIAPVTGCDKLSLGAAEFTFRPEANMPSTPTGFEADFSLPQTGLTDPEALATPPPKRTAFTFPEGVALNPSAADGLATCSLKQIGFREFGDEPNRFRFDKAPQQCPDASKVGSLEVQTPLLDNPLKGALYLAAQDENPFGSTLAVYLVVEDPSVGITIKLPGRAETDPVTGQLRTVFEDLPQTPFAQLALKIKGGDRAPLTTPDTCARATTTGQITPWSAPESGADATTEDSFEIGGAPGCPTSRAARPFHPSFSAGTASTVADTFSPLEFKLSRKDGEQELKGLRITLPRGLTGKIAGIATCTEAEIAAAQHRSGKEEQASPSCPASSRLGTIYSAAGIGPAPIHVGGALYLAGPYKGAPLSAVAIVPAVAGPYDLGNVVSRAAVRVDPATAQLTATTDPIPDVLKGVPVALRSLRVVLDRPGFTLTPTSCERAAIEAEVSGASNTTSSSSAPFQVGGCEGLAFKPKLTARLRGGTRRGDHPAFSTTLTFPAGGGYANTRDVQVTLPHSEFLDQAHIRTVCTRVQFAAGECPQGSIYGHVEARTPLLDQPFTGNVYLRSSDNKLPDLVLALKGPPSLPVEVVLDGRVDSIKGGIRTTFEDVPDAPVSRVVLRMSGARKGLLVNSRNLCKGKPARLAVSLVGQNNRRADQSPVLQNGCPKAAKG